MDRNQAIGLVLISVMLILYMTFFAPEPVKEIPQTKGTPTASAQPDAVNPNPSQPDSLQMARRQLALGAFGKAATGTAEQAVLQNEKLKVTFNSRGGRVEEVLLKEYKTWDQKPLILFDKASNTTDISFKTTDNRTVKFSDLVFKARPAAGQVLTYRAELAPNQYIEQTYSLPKGSYELGYQLHFVGLNSLVAATPLEFTWQSLLKRVEFDVKQNRDRSYLTYMTVAEEFDKVVGNADEPEVVTLEEPVKWVSNKQSFFTTALIAKNAFGKASLKSVFNEADTVHIKSFASQLAIPVKDVLGVKGEYTYFFGPNDYQILKQMPADFEKNIDLGWSVFAYVNKFLVIPVFNFLEQYFVNYGIIIILYKSYLSMAKMKVLKPEIDAIKEKNEGDMQKSQQETMKLYSSMGVNPLSGCVPMLLQIPILFALLNFFPNSIELRQEPFLWAHDLSTYDVFARLPFTIPFYGNHVSMFTLLMTISTILYTWQNNQVNTMQGPMKFYSYLMPVMIMFVVNSFSAGLSFYYFVANIVTFGQQAIIRYFVDDKKIRAKLEENQVKNKDKKPGGFQKRLQDAMKAASEREAQQKKATKGKSK
jgi:YidC/Oxa1 family membrane protein insertase